MSVSDADLLEEKSFLGVPPATSESGSGSSVAAPSGYGLLDLLLMTAPRVVLEGGRRIPRLDSIALPVLRDAPLLWRGASSLPHG